jgi:ribonucleoside-diphosphate reductase alpha chain
MATVEMGRERRTKSRTTREVRGDRNGLKIETRFCPTERVQTRLRQFNGKCGSAAIKDESARLCLSRPTAKSRQTWSQLATNVVVSKYFYGDPQTTPKSASILFGS